MLEDVKCKLFALLVDRNGIAALEYAILAGAIIGVVATAAATVGSDVRALLNAIANKLTAATNAV